MQTFSPNLGFIQQFIHVQIKTSTYIYTNKKATQIILADTILSSQAAPVLPSHLINRYMTYLQFSFPVTFLFQNLLPLEWDEGVLIVEAKTPKKDKHDEVWESRKRSMEQIFRLPGKQTVLTNEQTCNTVYQGKITQEPNNLARTSSVPGNGKSHGSQQDSLLWFVILLIFSTQLQVQIQL